MNSFALKLIACITMLIDHVGYIFFPKLWILRTIGRLAFPIFAWQISVGYTNSSNKVNYFKRLLLFALITQPIYMYALNPAQLNIFFTLILGLISIWVYDKADNKYVGVFVNSIIFLIAHQLNVSYGAYGVIIIFLFYIFRNNIVLLFLGQLIVVLVYAFDSTAFIQIFSLVALMPIILYNGQRGPKLKYIFYAFYPIHLLGLYLLNICLK